MTSHPPVRSRYFGLLTQRVRWGLSLRGLFALGISALALAAIWIFGIYSFLAVTDRENTPYLSVEGWLDDNGIRAAVAEFRDGMYVRVFTTGGPVRGIAHYINDYSTAANIGAAHLRERGIDAAFIQAVPSRVRERDRTYSAAVALRNWMRDHHPDTKAINVMTVDVHARRTRLLFQLAFGDSVKVGVVGIPSPEYDKTSWWHFSQGVRDVIGESIAYICESFLLSINITDRGMQIRIRELDGIRGLAILSVVVCHYIQNPLLVVGGDIAKYTAKALSLSWSGVDLFFVLSGFLICGILCDHRSSPTLFKAFYLRRCTRVLPLYFLTLGLFLLAKHVLNIPPLLENVEPTWAYATFTQNITMALREGQTNYWMGLTWSLAVEEQFYLVLPIVVCFVPRRRLPHVFICGVIIAICLRIWSPGHHAYVLTPWRADSLLAGALLALLVRNQSTMSWVRINRTAIVTAFGIFLVGAAIMTAKPWSPWARNHAWLAGLFFMLILVVLTEAIPTLNKLLVQSWMMWLGKVSFGVYLLHSPIAGLLHWFLAGSGVALQTANNYLATALAVAVTLVLAGLSYRFFESPLLKLSHAYKYEANLQESLSVDATRQNVGAVK